MLFKFGNHTLACSHWHAVATNPGGSGLTHASSETRAAVMTSLVEHTHTKKCCCLPHTEPADDWQVAF